MAGDPPRTETALPTYERGSTVYVHGTVLTSDPVAGVFVSFDTRGLGGHWIPWACVDEQRRPTATARVCLVGDTGEVLGPSENDVDAVRVRWMGGVVTSHKRASLRDVQTSEGSCAAGSSACAALYGNSTPGVGSEEPGNLPKYKKGDRVLYQGVEYEVEEVTFYGPNENVLAKSPTHGTVSAFAPSFTPWPKGEQRRESAPAIPPMPTVTKDAPRFLARRVSELNDEVARLRRALKQIEDYERGRDPGVNSTYSMCVAHGALTADCASAAPAPCTREEFEDAQFKVMAEARADHSMCGGNYCFVEGCMPPKSTAHSSGVAESPIARPGPELRAIVDGWLRTLKTAADEPGTMAAIVHKAIEMGPVAVGFLVDVAVSEERERCAHAVAQNKSAKETLDMILRPESAKGGA